MRLSEIKMALQNVLMQFRRFDADGGFALEVTEEELAEGLEVIVYDPEGNKLENPDGELTWNGNKVTVVEGKIKSIEPIEEVIKEEVKEEVKPEVEVEVEAGCKKKVMAEEEAPAVEEPKEDEKDVRIAELEAIVAERDEKIKEMAAAIEERDRRIEELEKKPAAEPIREEFEKATEPTKTGNKKLDRLSQILNA